MTQQHRPGESDPPAGWARRQLLKTAGWLGLAWLVGDLENLPQALGGSRSGMADKARGSIHYRLLGRTGVSVSALGIGGGHLLNTSDEEGIRIVREAIDEGVTFFDNAWDYYNTRSEQVMGKALEGRRQQVFLMTKMCTHGRGKAVGMLHLEQSLRHLRTDYLDLWQIHEVGCEDDPDRMFAPGGVLEALVEAKRQGKVRFIGFTGHTDPRIHLAVLQRGFQFDTCQIPLNAFDPAFRSFETQVLPELIRQGIAPIGMKSLCGNAKPIRDGVLTVEEALRYALSLPVATVVSGIESVATLRENLAIVRRFTPMTSDEAQALRARVASAAADGRYEFYKTDKLWSCDRREVDERFRALEGRS